MRRGGYRGPEQTLGLLGCALLIPVYLIIFGWLIDNGPDVIGRPKAYTILILVTVIAPALAWLLRRVPTAMFRELPEEGVAVRE